MRSDALPQAKPGLELEELEGIDEVVVIDGEGQRCVSLNLTAAAVLEMCDGKHTAQNIANEITQASGADSVQVEADVAALLAELTQYQLLES
ncbi:MAG: PqqD family protein [Mariprofundales bacterium]|nr:PqqD family protein [Mariprofundales bacterium]